MDYLRPYSLAHPVQSFTVLEQAPEPEYGYEDTFPTAEGTVQHCCKQTRRPKRCCLHVVVLFFVFLLPFVMYFFFSCRVRR